MREPTLVILAAGMGSRFGGLKQITDVDGFGHAIIDFSLYDAYRAGFRRAAFVIKREIEADFKAFIGRRMEKYFHVDYIYQSLDVLPRGYGVPQGREKPWGTGHATLCAKGAVSGPFAVVNADDFYGPGAYRALFDFLSAGHGPNEHAIVAYLLRNTVTEHGSVARGICQARDGFLTGVDERLGIEKRGDDGAYPQEDGSWVTLPGDTPVSMNCWAFGEGMWEELSARFPLWLDTELPKDPLKREYFLPGVVNGLIQDGTGRVRVLNCHESWFGMTYREDLESVRQHIRQMRAQGVYPQALLE